MFLNSSDEKKSINNNAENYINLWNIGSIDIGCLDEIPEVFYKTGEFSVRGEGSVNSILQSTIVANLNWWRMMIQKEDTYALYGDHAIMPINLGVCTELNLSDTKVIRCEGGMPVVNSDGKKIVCQFVLYSNIENGNMKFILFGNRSKNRDDFIKVKEAADAIMATYRPLQ